MSVRFETIKPGDVLLDVHSERMGNTTMREVGVWPVYVESIDPKTRSMMARWNGNPARWYGPDGIRKLRRWAPEWLARRLWGPGERFYCYHCGATSAEKDSAKHRLDCPHPKAVAFRKKAARTASEARP